MVDESGFSTEVIKNWADFLAIRRDFGLGWLFRGHAADWPLKTTLERACYAAGIPLKEATAIEAQLIRDFHRRYDGEDRDLVVRDTLYCLALMQHYGAPTRLLDCSYSPFVAAYFALECAESVCFVWCIDGQWCLTASRSLVPDIDQRNVDSSRNDTTFRRFYHDEQRRFVFPENPLLFNRRQIIQQGVFLCPGDVSELFESNLKAMSGWRHRHHVVKLRFDFNRHSKREAMEDLYAMNVTRATLFPGLDGFAQSLRHRMWFYQEMAKHRIGEAPPN
jgi:hypothetical protein